LRKKLLDRIIERNKQKETVHQIPVRKTRWLEYAATLLILFTVGAFIFINNKKPSEKIPDKTAISLTDVPPGSNKAVLTLSNGLTIDLDDAKNGSLGTQGNSKIIKVAEGQVSYTNHGARDDVNEYNTMTTPRGGQYRLQLPDGTLVWLNAASSITFPVSFSNDTRRVSITGEAYFEVARDISKPFIVAINDQTEVRVLGTHFNISSYKDEPLINTTLIEGSIRIIHARSSEILVAGQQASISANSKIKIINDANIEEVLAWKNGFFHFEGTSLEVVMRQLSRWYDTEVIFEGDVPDIELVGNISRNINASGVLKMLAFTGVRFRIENKKIIVMSK